MHVVFRRSTYDRQVITKQNLDNSVDNYIYAVNIQLKHRLSKPQNATLKYEHSQNSTLKTRVSQDLTLSKLNSQNATFKSDF